MCKKAVFTLLALVLFVCGSVSPVIAINGLAPVGQAFVNPGGRGDALIYGYYNVRGTVGLIEVVNTSTRDGQKVRMIFRAGRNGEAVLDFDICLSKGDVWTGIIIDNGTTATICRLDADTVTAPEIPDTCRAFNIPPVSTLTNDDLREGYIEVVGLSMIPLYDKNVALRNIITTPFDCANWVSLPVPAGSNDAENVLIGSQTTIDLTTLATFHYNAVAISNTNLVAIGDPGPGQGLTLTQVSNLGCTIERIFATSEIDSPYDIIADLGGETEIVVTFPTRRACHRCDDPGSVVNNLGLNSCAPSGAGNIFNCTAATADVCTAYETTVAITARDDAENTQNVSRLSPAGGSFLPFEVNVVKVGSSNIWNSTLAQSFNPTAGFDLGWVKLNVVHGAATQGLPAIVYTTQAFAGREASHMTPAIYSSLIP